MKGYKGFGPGLVCRGKQYAENSVHEEKDAVICDSGMHFCKNPFDVLNFYGFVNGKAEINDFAEVEAMDEAHTDDNIKFCTKKLRVGARIGIPGRVKAFVDFTFSKIDFDNATATNTGDYSAATNTGYRSAATNTGDMSAARVEGSGSVAIVTGKDSKVSGKTGCWIVAAERDNDYHILAVRAAMVDGECIKPDVFYKLVDGEFVEADE